MFGAAVWLLRLAQKRFGATVTGPSQALLEHITDSVILEDLGEALLDCADGEARLGWLCWRGRSANEKAIALEHRG